MRSSQAQPVHSLTLVTRNVEDFHWVQGLSLLNPFDAEPQAERDQQSEREGRMNDGR